MKSKLTAGLLCLLLGGLGLHEFYLGDNKKGVYYILAFILCAITGYGAILYLLFQIGVAIHYFTMDQAKFDEKYNGIKRGVNAAYNPNPSAKAFQSIDSKAPVDNLDSPQQNESSSSSKVDKFRELKQLLDEQLISQEEFEIKKNEILNS